jgi:hypothetical protein
MSPEKLESSGYSDEDEVMSVRPAQYDANHAFDLQSPVQVEFLVNVVSGDEVSSWSLPKLA